MGKSKTRTENKTESKVEVRSRDELVRKEILDAKNQIQVGYLDYAKLLTEAYHNSYHEKWGFNTFEEYCSKELDTEYRKARYFIDIWDKVKALDLPKEKVNALGWTKMKEVASVITEKNAKEWLEKAQKMTSRELAEAAKIVRKKDTTDMDVPSITTLTLRMTEAEANVILEAIDEAKNLCDSTNAVIAMEMICQDWLTAKGVTPQRTSLKDYIDYIEKLYGVKVKVTKGESKTDTEKEAEEILETPSEGADDEEDEEADDVDIDDILGID